MIIHDVEQRSPDWFALRSGIPTASNFSSIITGTGKESAQLKKYALQLAAEKIGGYELFSIPQTADMERGEEIENEARDWYSLEHGVDVKTVGFMTDDAIKFGASPDGMIKSEGYGLEIKSLRTSRHLDVWLRKRETGNPPPDYIPQVQGNLFVSGLSKWVLLYYHPAAQIPCVEFTIYPDQAYFAKLAPALESLIQERDKFVDILRHDAGI